MLRHRAREVSKGIVWVCGMFFAIMGVLGQIPVMPQHAMQLVILLYVFMFASTILFITSMERRQR